MKIIAILVEQLFKLSSRYKFAEDKVILRSVSTGFRALHYTKFILKKSQYSFVPGQGIQVSGIK
jgi:iron complex outermembrane receptor protein